MAANMQAGNHPATGLGARWRRLLWGGAAGLLALPAIAMWLGTDGVAWTGSDFAVMGLLLAIACAAVECSMRLARGNRAYATASSLAIACGFLVVWVTLAVGIVGEPEHPANLVFLAGVAALPIGALVARGRAAGMDWVMRVVAAIQAAAVTAAVLASSVEGIVFGGLMVGGSLLAALLFRRASQQPVLREPVHGA